MKVLYIIRTSGHIRTHASTIRALTDRDHTVEVLYDPRFSNDLQNKKARAVCNDLKVAIAPAVVASGVGAFLLRHTRDLLSYRRYLVNKDIAHLEPFRKDWKGHLSVFSRAFLKLPFGTRILLSEYFAWALSLFERLVPPNHAVRKDILARNPDVVVTCPVNMRESSAELEYLKAASVLGIKTALPVYSWDNLTVRGLYHVMPDRLLCWNATQADEARRHQNVSIDRIRIVGAPVFDSWFERKAPTTPREEFCSIHGLDPKKHIVTYLGSARNIAQSEADVICGLRSVFDAASDGRVREMQIALRVHPGNYKAYVNFSLPGVVEVPPRGSLPDTEEALQLFHDTLAHSIAVIQINTSGAIDAIIDGKPCISLLYPEFKTQQVETIHFKQLMESGATDLPRTPEECVFCLTQLLNGADTCRDARRRFIESFIRPRGLSRAVGEWAADEIEELVQNRHDSLHE